MKKEISVFVDLITLFLQMPYKTILHPLEKRDLLLEAHKNYQAICNFLDSAENKIGGFTFEDFLKYT